MDNLTSNAIDVYKRQHQYSVAAVKAALEHIKRFRVEAVKGKSDDELKTLLIRTVKGDDPDVYKRQPKRWCSPSCSSGGAWGWRKAWGRGRASVRR